VKIPGYGSTKMNAAYAFGGMDLLDQTLEQNFGVQVDGFVEVNFNRFAEVIDLLGGVDMELRADEASMINYALNRYELGKGMMHLDGAQALYYSRIRNLDADADFSRTNRQRKVITALIEKFRNTKLTTLLGLLDDLLPMISTNMSNGEIIDLATDLFPMLAGCTIVSQRVPGDGAYHMATIDGLSCVVADMDAARKLLAETMGD
jgi:LCP family protein required for cell wall assembly